MAVHRMVWRPGFTLIELIVVIAVIALLIGLLLPALSAATNEARKAKSLSNMRQIVIANTTYAVDWDGFSAIVPSGLTEGPSPFDPNPRPPQAIYHAPNRFGFGGKEASLFHRRELPFLGYLDLAPSVRPLNAYLYPDKHLGSVTGETPFYKPGRARTELERTDIELEFFSSPGDRGSYDRWPTNVIMDPTFVEARKPSPEISSYDDIGTSYITNTQFHNWALSYNAIKQGFNDQGYYFRTNNEVFDEVMKRIATTSMVRANDFVLYYDSVGRYFRSEFFERAIPPDTPALEGDFGGEYKAVMGFLDGRAGYIQHEWGKLTGKEYTYITRRRGEVEEPM